MRLFVDDLRICPPGWELARTNTEAIRLLATGFVQEISIDHDICVPNVEFIGQSIRKRLKIGEETYQPVVYYIAAMKKEFRPNTIYLHSANPQGVEKMESILKDAGIECTVQESTQLFDLDEHDGNKPHCGCDCRGCLGLIPGTEMYKINQEMLDNNE